MNSLLRAAWQDGNTWSGNSDHPLRRKVAGKGAAAPDRTDDLQFRVVSLQYLPHDRQPETRATGVPRMAGIDAVQPLGQPGDVAGVDAFTGIRDAEMGTLPVCLPADGDLRLVGGVSHRVGNEVGEGGANLLRVAAQGRR